MEKACAVAPTKCPVSASHRCDTARPPPLDVRPLSNLTRLILHPKCRPTRSPLSALGVQALGSPSRPPWERGAVPGVRGQGAEEKGRQGSGDKVVGRGTAARKEGVEDRAGMAREESNLVAAPFGVVLLHSPAHASLQPLPASPPLWPVNN